MEHVEPKMPWNQEWDNECYEAALRGGIASTRAMIERSPNTGAGYSRIGEGIAIFQGNDAAMTRVSGLGTHREVAVKEIEAAEDFFRERGGNYSRFSVSSLSHASLRQILQQSGYVTGELSESWGRDIPSQLPEIRSSTVKVKRVSLEDSETWCRIVAAGFDGVAPSQITPRVMEVFFALGFAQGSNALLALINSAPVGGGVVSVHGRVASLSTTSVLPQHRRQGVQQALLAERFRIASQQNCSCVVAGSAIDSESARNLARFGFERRSRRFSMTRDFTVVV